MSLNMLLYAAMLFCGGCTGVLASDEAAKWIEPKTLFWLRSGFSVADIVLTGLKALTSNSFQEWIASRQSKPQPVTEQKP